MSSRFLHIINLICAAESIALDSNDFVDSMLREHSLNWIRYIRLKVCEAVFRH